MQTSERNDGIVAQVAAAVLDGTPVDWASAESESDRAARPLIKHLKALATLADIHRIVHPTLSAAAAAAGPAAAPLETWGHLRILEPIGRGSFGEVYRAWDDRLDREVALKLLPASPSQGDGSTSAVIQEGRLLARVRHPSVVTIYGAEQIGDRIGLWMELVRGQTLEQLLAQGTVFSATKAVEIGLELCRAVSAVHGAGLLHRDIKAHNVTRADDGRVALMDFGTGRELDDSSTSDLAGTPLYLAPEVLRGQAATVLSDVYSLGVLLYHLVTRDYPVKGRTVRDLRLAHERGERTDVRSARPDVSPKLARIIERAIDPRPEHRYGSATALAADLEAIGRRSRARLWLAGSAAAATVLAITGFWATWGGWFGADRSAADIGAPSTAPVIAVLPFKNLSAEPDSDYFVDGLTDEMIRNLSVIDGLAVRSSTSSFAFKNKPRNTREVGEQLNANLVLEGSVLRSGTQLRINAQLVRAADDVPLWSGRFDRELKDIFAIQDEISRSIVNELRLKLGRGQRRYDTNVETYELYLRARALADRRSVPTSENAAELFEQAIARDSAFAPAYAGLANAYAWMPMLRYQGISFERARSIMRSAAVKALELDPLLAEAHAAMGVVYSSEFDWPNAEKSFRRAIDLNPSLTHIYTSYSISTLRPLGRIEEAEHLIQVALQNDPLSPYALREIGHLQFTVGRYAEAIDTLQRVRAIEPDLPFVESYLARALMFAGRLAEAIPLLENPQNPHIDELQRTYLAHAYVMAGRYADAEKLAAEHKGYPYRTAVIYVALGDKDRAFEALEQMVVDEPQRLGLVLTFPELALLRGDARLAALRRRIGLP